MVAYFVDFRISCAIKLQKRAKAMLVHNFALNFTPDARNTCSILTLNRTLGAPKRTTTTKNVGFENRLRNEAAKSLKMLDFGRPEVEHI